MSMLIITKNNAEQELNQELGFIHDTVLNRLLFYKEDKKLVLEIEKGTATEVWNDVIGEYETCDDAVEKAFIIYKNVIGYTMSACDYWGKNPLIFDFEYIESESEQMIIPKLFAIKDAYEYIFSSLKERNAYIETKVTFSSGDFLLVACEQIEVL